MDKARVLAAQQHGDEDAADHGHQAVHGHQAADAVQGLGRHDVEAKPADGQNPGAQGEEGDVGGGKGHHLAVAVAPISCTQNQYGRQGDPAAHRVHYNGAGKVVEGCTKLVLQPALETIVAVPDQPLKEGIDKGDNQA